ncbi:hypothetical protein I350_06410 [Cryptococcus amylolentus CBS 6273]|uniref:DDHD domain-containing protein n=1 Tax=Cryptococcus amylolentus CBS 6273 TaxID=1296118 RepID=A0A1E3JL64_9TREE|nr:hypothetical protein I350_06410 [Cryptococcus amylolentus CBS 6273]
MAATAPEPPRPESPPLLPVPQLDTRWVHAGAQHLDLLPTPITTTTTVYKAFSQPESQRIDAQWHALPPDERDSLVKVWGAKDGEGVPATRAKERSGSSDKGSNKAKPKPSSEGNVAEQTHPVDAKVNSERKGGARSETSEVSETSDQSSPELELEEEFRQLMAEPSWDSQDLGVIKGVPVSQDSLFEVSLRTLSLHPVFWAHTGPRVAVLRGTWFLTDETKPCCWELAEELEKAYLEIQPWQPSYQHELSTALSLGQAGEEKLKYSLPPRFGQGLGVIFENENRGRLITQVTSSRLMIDSTNDMYSSGTLTYMARALWDSIRSKASGTYIYRGFAAACAASGKEPTDVNSPGKSQATSRRGSHNSNRSSVNEKSPSTRLAGLPKQRPQQDTVVEAAMKGITKDAKQTLEGVKKDLKEVHNQKIGERPPGLSPDDRRAREEENAPLIHDTEDYSPCTDLILVVHGIGQQLAAQYEAYNFVYAGNQLRQSLRKQSSNPALASIIRDRRCQVLPVQWRASLDLDDQKTAEDAAHGMDNRFTIADITINRSIPYVRELTNAVLLDIPLFMSHHRQKMIEAVCTQANKLYRLWIARNPGFEKNGRVHIVGHSLGSALVAHILSDQPTKIPTISDLPKSILSETRDRFLFNTSNLFLCGSPLGIFLHLDQAQIMPRKGRERTMNSPPDEALDRAGKFGCLSIDSLYNIFYHTDPIAYQLNAAVDSNIASTTSPLAITSVTSPFYAPVTDSISSISRYLPSALGGRTGDAASVRPGAVRLPSGIEMAGPAGEERLEGSRGERRFSALNPHGNVDFYLPSAGVSEYLDMLTAHLSYWTDPSFAAFVLAETFSTRLDLVRTGMGLADHLSNREREAR